MKLLLFDQNISPRLVNLLADVYPGSAHVSELGMGNAMDIEIWEYAHNHDFMIATKDADFSFVLAQCPHSGMQYKKWNLPKNDNIGRRSTR